MKKIALFLCFFLATLTIQATVWTTKNVPIIHLQDSDRYVCNPEGILSQAACDTIDAIFRAVEDSTSVQALIAVLSDIDPSDCHEFSRLLGEEAGVGLAGKDNGIVVVLSTTERDISFSVGYGLEGVITDALSKRIQLNYMVPYLKDNNWDRGMVEGMRELGKCLINPELANHSDYSGDLDSNVDKGILLLTILFVLCPFLLLYLAVRKSRKCPNCGKYKLKFNNTKTLYSDKKGRKVRYTYTCKNCGHQVVRDHYISNASSSGGGGSFGGGFGGSGGSRGGSYGGGHFGGGGAHTKF